MSVFAAFFDSSDFSLKIDDFLRPGKVVARKFRQRFVVELDFHPFLMLRPNPIVPAGTKSHSIFNVLGGKSM
jgi:hypothetical protein